MEYDLEMCSITHFDRRGKNKKNIGIRISKHLVTLLFFLLKNDILPRRLSTYRELVLS